MHFVYSVFFCRQLQNYTNYIHNTWGYCSLITQFCNDNVHSPGKAVKWHQKAWNGNKMQMFFVLFLVLAQEVFFFVVLKVTRMHMNFINLDNKVFWYCFSKYRWNIQKHRPPNYLQEFAKKKLRFISTLVFFVLNSIICFSTRKEEESLLC